MWWVQARDAARQCTVHRTAPTTKDYLALTVSRAKVERLASRFLFECQALNKWWQSEGTLGCRGHSNP